MTGLRHRAFTPWGRFPCLVACFLVGTTAFLGCSTTTPVTHYYTLAPPTEAATASSGGGGLVLGIEPFRVDPPYDRDEVVYRMGKDSTEVGFYNYHRWAAPLGHLVTVGLVDGLRGASGIARVEPASALGNYDAVLRGRVIRAEELDLPGSQEAHLELEVQLVMAGEVRWQQRIRGTKAGQVETVDRVMKLLEQAFAVVVDEVRTGLTDALTTLDAS